MFLEVRDTVRDKDTMAVSADGETSVSVCLSELRLRLKSMRPLSRMKFIQCV